MPVKLGRRPSQTVSACSATIVLCDIKPEDVATERSRELLAKLELENLDLILRKRRLCWFGHVEHSSSAVRIASDIQVDGRWGQGGPR